METPVKLPLLRLGSLSASPRRDSNNAGGDGEERAGLGALPPLTSPSRAAQLLFSSAPSASSQSLAALKQRRPRRPLEPEDFAKSPLELATEQLRAVRERLGARLERLSATQAQFEREETQLAFVTQQLRGQQRVLVAQLARFFDAQARQIQRAFRGHRGRRVFRQLVAVRAVLRIQRAFRASCRRRDKRRRRLRLLCRKVLRGLRSVRERHELAHHELLSRVNHNLLIEAQWRQAMGIDDAESDLMTALYRKRYVRRRLGEVLRRANALRSIVNYWRGLVPRAATAEADTEGGESQDEGGGDDRRDGAGSGEDDEEGDDRDSVGDEASVIVIRKARAPAVGAPRSKNGEVPGRMELLRRQRAYTRRVQEENQKRGAGHARELDLQRKLEQLAESEKRRADEQQRKQRVLALQPELERRGLRAIREQQAKRDRELKLQQEAEQRAAEAKRAIAAQMLSAETQQRMLRHARRQEQKRA